MESMWCGGFTSPPTHTHQASTVVIYTEFNRFGFYEVHLLAEPRLAAHLPPTHTPASPRRLRERTTTTEGGRGGEERILPWRSEVYSGPPGTPSRPGAARDRTGSEVHAGRPAHGQGPVTPNRPARREERTPDGVRNPPKAARDCLGHARNPSGPGYARNGRGRRQRKGPPGARTESCAAGACQQAQKTRRTDRVPCRRSMPTSRQESRRTDRVLCRRSSPKARKGKDGKRA